jgi:hypothetical protein
MDLWRISNPPTRAVLLRLGQSRFRGFARVNVVSGQMSAMGRKRTLTAQGQANLMTWGDPSYDQYRHDRLSEFGLSARARGMKSAVAAQLYISQQRAMYRRLRSNPEVTWRDWKRIFRRPGWRDMPGRWIINRCKQRLDRALRQGADQRSLERRGLFEPLKGHQEYRGMAKLRQHVRQPNRRR